MIPRLLVLAIWSLLAAPLCAQSVVIDRWTYSATSWGDVTGFVVVDPDGTTIQVPRLESNRHWQDAIDRGATIGGVPVDFANLAQYAIPKPATLAKTEEVDAWVKARLAAGYSTGVNVGGQPFKLRMQTEAILDYAETLLAIETASFAGTETVPIYGFIAGQDGTTYTTKFEATANQIKPRLTAFLKQYRQGRDKVIDWKRRIAAGDTNFVVE